MKTTSAKEILKINILKWYLFTLFFYAVINILLFKLPFIDFLTALSIDGLIAFLLYMIVMYIILKIQLTKSENRIYFSPQGIHQGNNLITWETLRIDKIKHVFPAYEEKLFLCSQVDKTIKIKFDVGSTNDESFMDLINKYCPPNNLLRSYSIDYASRKKNFFYLKKSKIY